MGEESLKKSLFRFIYFSKTGSQTDVQPLFKSTPRASAREDLRTKLRSADLAVFREAF